MGKVVVSQFISLDSVVEAPGGAEVFDRGGWAFKFDRGPEGDKFKLTELKRDVGGDILVNGSVQLVRTLMEHSLVDEYRLMVSPTVLGAGKRLFGETRDTVSLRHVDEKPAGETLNFIYEPSAKDAGSA